MTCYLIPVAGHDVVSALRRAVHDLKVRMISSHQMKAARALLGIDQRELAELSGLSLPTIQRMEASDGQVRGVVETLVKVVDAFEKAGVELIGPGKDSAGQGRGVRMIENREMK